MYSDYCNIGDNTPTPVAVFSVVPLDTDALYNAICVRVSAPQLSGGARRDRVQCHADVRADDSTEITKSKSQKIFYAISPLRRYRLSHFTHRVDVVCVFSSCVCVCVFWRARAILKKKKNFLLSIRPVEETLVVVAVRISVRVGQYLVFEYN